MKKETKEFLKRRRVNTSLPIIIKFKKFNGSSFNVKARKFDFVVKWKDVLKAIRMEKEKWMKY